MGQVVDPYTFANGPGNTADGTQVNARINAILGQVNGNLDDTNLAPTTSARLGLSQSGSPRRGQSVTTGTDNLTSATYALLGAPDKVAGIVVPSGGILSVSYRALVTMTAGNNITIAAALFLGSSQVKNLWNNSAPSISNPGYNDQYVDATYTYGSATVAAVYATHPVVGMAVAGLDGAGHAPGASDLTSGQQIGPFFEMRVNPGTYDVSIRWLISAGGSGTVSDRALIVKAEQFT